VVGTLGQKTGNATYTSLSVNWFPELVGVLNRDDPASKRVRRSLRRAFRPKAIHKILRALLCADCSGLYPCVKKYPERWSPRTIRSKSSSGTTSTLAQCGGQTRNRFSTRSPLSLMENKGGVRPCELRSGRGDGIAPVTSPTPRTCGFPHPALEQRFSPPRVFISVNASHFRTLNSELAIYSLASARIHRCSK